MSTDFDHNLEPAHLEPVHFKVPNGYRVDQTLDRIYKITKIAVAVVGIISGTLVVGVTKIVTIDNELKSHAEKIEVIQQTVDRIIDRELNNRRALNVR